MQACGDAHLLNFGIFASPERTLLFDVNDFDETLPGPWEANLKRLVTSVVLAGRNAGFSAAQNRDAALDLRGQHILLERDRAIGLSDLFCISPTAVLAPISPLLASFIVDCAVPIKAE